MISEFTPKGYKSWHHYYTVKAKRVARIKVALIVLTLLAAYAICGYIEHC